MLELYGITESIIPFILLWIFLFTIFNILGIVIYLKLGKKFRHNLIIALASFILSLVSVLIHLFGIVPSDYDVIYLTNIFLPSAVVLDLFLLIIVIGIYYHNRR